MAMGPQMQADDIHSFDRTGFVARAVHIERYKKIRQQRLGIPFPATPVLEKCRFLAAILLQFPRFRRLLVTLALLGIPLEQE